MASKRNRLYRNDELGCVGCRSCRELIEIPDEAILKVGYGPVPIKANPENLLIWIELQEMGHGCSRAQEHAELFQNPAVI